MIRVTLVYILLSHTAGLVDVLFTTIAQFVWAWLSLTIAQNIHTKLLSRVLRAPSSFFHQTPTGRIVNRFGKDMNSVDGEIPVRIAAVAITPAIQEVLERERERES